MARIAKYSATITANGSGAGSATVGPVSGYLVAVAYVKNNFANGVDIDVTAQVGSRVLLSADDVDASDVFYPLVLASLNTSGADITGVYSRIPLAEETVTIAVASAGSGTTGTFYVYVEGTP